MCARNLFLSYLVLISLSMSCSGLSYYTGPISVNSIDASLMLTSASSANVIVRYTIVNNGSAPLSVPFIFLGFPATTTYEGLSAQGSSLTLSLPVGETTLAAQFVQPLDSLTSLSLNTAYQIEGKTPVAKIGRIEYLLELASIPLVFVESMPLLDSRGVTTYGLVKTTTYPLGLHITFQQRALQADVSRTISAYGAVGDDLIFTTTVTNTGASTMSGLTLQDSLFTSYFEPLSPEYAAIALQGVGEQVSVYTSSPFSLTPGEQKVITYRARVTQLGAPAFPGARLFSEGNYITSSEETTVTVLPVHITEERTPLLSNATTYQESLVTPFSETNHTLPLTGGEITPVLYDEEKEIFARQTPGADVSSSSLIWYMLVAGLLILVAGAGIYYIIRTRHQTSGENV